MKYHIILETNGICTQLSQRAHSYDKAVRRARKLAREIYPDRDLTNISTGCIIEEYTQVYIIESEQ
jgi:ATP-dependent protease HslVU (ClpYQ) peptidase subunit